MFEYMMCGYRELYGDCMYGAYGMLTGYPLAELQGMLVLVTKALCTLHFVLRKENVYLHNEDKVTAPETIP